MKLLAAWSIFTYLVTVRSIEVCFKYKSGYESMANAVSFPFPGTADGSDMCETKEQCGKSEDPELIFMANCPVKFPLPNPPPQEGPGQKESGKNMLIVMVPVVVFPKASFQTSVEEEREVNFLTGVELETLRAVRKQVSKLEKISNTTAKRVCFAMDAPKPKSISRNVTQPHINGMCVMGDDWSLICPPDFNNTLNKTEDETLLRYLSNLYSPKPKRSNRAQRYPVSKPLASRNKDGLCVDVSGQDYDWKEDNLLKYLSNIYASKPKLNYKFTVFELPGNNVTSNTTVEEDSCTVAMNSMAFLSNSTFNSTLDKTEKSKQLTENDLWLSNSLVLLELDSCPLGDAIMMQEQQEMCSKNDTQPNTKVELGPEPEPLCGFSLHDFFKPSNSKLKKECVIVD